MSDERCPEGLSETREPVEVAKTPSGRLLWSLTVSALLVIGLVLLIIPSRSRGGLADFVVFLSTVMAASSMIWGLSLVILLAKWRRWLLRVAGVVCFAGGLWSGACLIHNNDLFPGGAKVTLYLAVGVIGFLIMARWLNRRGWRLAWAAPWPIWATVIVGYLVYVNHELRDYTQGGESAMQRYATIIERQDEAALSRWRALSDAKMAPFLYDNPNVVRLRWPELPQHDAKQVVSWELQGIVYTVAPWSLDSPRRSPRNLGGTDAARFNLLYAVQYFNHRGTGVRGHVVISCPAQDSSDWQLFFYPRRSIEEAKGELLAGCEADAKARGLDVSHSDLEWRVRQLGSGSDELLQLELDRFAKRGLSWRWRWLPLSTE